MKSSELPHETGARNPQNPLYGILAVYIPWSILATGVPLIGRIVTHLLPGISFPYISIFVVVFLCGITVSFYAGMMNDRRTSHTVSHIRGAIIITLAAYIIASLLRFDMALGRRFLPGLGNFLGALAALYVWVFVLYLREIFDARELFETHTRQYEGENLRRVMREDFAIMGDADINSKKLTTIYGAQLAIVGMLAIVTGILKIATPQAFRILLVLLYVSAACIFAILELFTREHYFAGEGIAVGAPERSKRITAILFFSITAATAALLFVSDNNILPISIITGFLAWLLSLLSRLGKPREEILFENENFAPPEALPSMDMGQFLGIEPAEPWPYWDYVKYAAIGLLIALFILFLIHPLLSRNDGSGKIPLRLKLARFVLQWFNTMRQGIAYFFSNLRKNDGSSRMNRRGAEEVKNMTADLFAAYSAAKKQEMRYSVTLFARLILWGTETLHVEWNPSFAPGEYCAELVRALPETGAEVIRCGELFEEALYGAEPLSREKQKEFKALVEKVEMQSG